jgi:hypothetical protein
MYASDERPVVSFDSSKARPFQICFSSDQPGRVNQRILTQRAKRRLVIPDTMITTREHELSAIAAQAPVLDEAAMRKTESEARLADIERILESEMAAAQTQPFSSSDAQGKSSGKKRAWFSKLAKRSDEWWTRSVRFFSSKSRAQNNTESALSQAAGGTVSYVGESCT